MQTLPIKALVPPSLRCCSVLGALRKKSTNAQDRLINVGQRYSNADNALAKFVVFPSAGKDLCCTKYCERCESEKLPLWQRSPTL